MSALRHVRCCESNSHHKSTANWILSQLAFEWLAVSCFEFDDGSRWLISDVRIECETSEHRRAKNFAWLSIGVYPIGLFALNCLVLLRCRSDILRGRRTALTMATSFLHREFSTGSLIPPMYLLDTVSNLSDRHQMGKEDVLSYAPF